MNKLPIHVEREAALAFMKHQLGLPDSASTDELHDAMLAVARDCWEGMLRRAQGTLDG